MRHDRTKSKHNKSPWVLQYIPSLEGTASSHIVIRPHSTRSVVSSKALVEVAPLQDVCAAAGWSSPQTFMKFYKMDMDSNPGTHVLSCGIPFLNSFIQVFAIVCLWLNFAIIKKIGHDLFTRTVSSFRWGAQHASSSGYWELPSWRRFMFEPIYVIMWQASAFHSPISQHPLIIIIW